MPNSPGRWPTSALAVLLIASAKRHLVSAGRNIHASRRPDHHGQGHPTPRPLVRWHSVPVTELVVLVDEAGRPIGEAPKEAVHGSRTPRHLAFSCYGFDDRGRLLVTQRAASKLTFPGVWTNTCCGHPAPGEPIEKAAARRLSYELGLTAEALKVVVPDFTYRASQDGVEENELCPVLTCLLTADPDPNPGEVQAWEWWTWERFRTAAADPSTNLAPWARLQAPLLEPLVEIQRRQS